MYDKEIAEVETKLQELSKSEDVKQYIYITNQLALLEKAIKAEVVKTGEVIGFHSVIDSVDIEYTVAKRNNFKPQVEDAKKQFGDEYIIETVDVKAMQKEPKCAVFLDECNKPTIYAVRRQKK